MFTRECVYEFVCDYVCVVSLYECVCMYMGGLHCETV